MILSGPGPLIRHQVACLAEQRAVPVLRVSDGHRASGTNRGTNELIEVGPRHDSAGQGRDSTFVQDAKHVTVALDEMSRRPAVIPAPTAVSPRALRLVVHCRGT